jgi:hypothetical protein
MRLLNFKANVLDVSVFDTAAVGIPFPKTEAYKTKVLGDYMQSKR